MPVAACKPFAVVPCWPAIRTAFQSRKNPGCFTTCPCLYRRHFRGVPQWRKAGSSPLSSIVHPTSFSRQPSKKKVSARIKTEASAGGDAVADGLTPTQGRGLCAKGFVLRKVLTVPGRRGGCASWGRAGRAFFIGRILSRIHGQGGMWWCGCLCRGWPSRGLVWPGGGHPRQD